MLVFISFILVVTFCTAPIIWAQYILRYHARHREDYPGTGAEFARHILDLSELESIKVEITKIGDHYDPRDKTVRLEEANYHGRTLTAVVIAAHEVGHALQDRDDYPPLLLRTKFAYASRIGENVARLVLLATPLITLINPRMALLSLGIFLAIVVVRVLFHIVTLPVEIDASFNRALPILEHGKYLSSNDVSAARTILYACAMTYIAATIFSVVDIFRYIRVWR